MPYLSLGWKTPGYGVKPTFTGLYPAEHSAGPGIQACAGNVGEGANNWMSEGMNAFFR